MAICNKIKAKLLYLIQRSLYHVYVVKRYRLIMCYKSWKQHIGNCFRFPRIVISSLPSKI